MSLMMRGRIGAIESRIIGHVDIAALVKNFTLRLEAIESNCIANKSCCMSYSQRSNNDLAGSKRNCGNLWLGAVSDPFLDITRSSGSSSMLNAPSDDGLMRRKRLQRDLAGSTPRNFRCRLI